MRLYLYIPTFLLFQFLKHYTCFFLILQITCLFIFLSNNTCAILFIFKIRFTDYWNSIFLLNPVLILNIFNNIISLVLEKVYITINVYFLNVLHFFFDFFNIIFCELLLMICISFEKSVDVFILSENQGLWN